MGNPQSQDLIDRFAERVVLEPDGCWSWDGPHDSSGYGRFRLGAPGQLTTGTHRFAYEWLIGPILEGLDLDHLCRNVGCCHPDHVEPVTRAENLKRSDVALGIRTEATHCVNGHEFTPENTYIRTSGRRACRECKRAYDRRVYHANLELARRKGIEKYHAAKARREQ